MFVENDDPSALILQLLQDGRGFFLDAVVFEFDQFNLGIGVQTFQKFGDFRLVVNILDPSDNNEFQQQILHRLHDSAGFESCLK
ncbi:hypothetical protein SDC9_109003 [bioreactor metagenome]|uniref:Uncharacterized protein n=1 Tax=bioreactor metagenome TaxID=1076179 RepID=A0A645B9R0_9ZZZZ